MKSDPEMFAQGSKLNPEPSPVPMEPVEHENDVDNLKKQLNPFAKQDNLLKKLLTAFCILFWFLLFVAFFVYTLLTVEPPSNVFWIFNILEPTDTEAFSNGVVSSDTLACSQIGRDILKKGGTAVDAAIAVVICLGVVSPFASGIGGGGFMLIHKASSNQQTFLDFREVAPLAATADMYNKNPNGSVSGGKAIAVPGEIAGLWEAWRTHGNLTWESLFLPSIQLAKSFPCSKLLELRIKQMGDVNDPVFKSIFYVGGRGALEGEIIKRTAYAQTLETISKQGPTAFYNGQLTADIVADIQGKGGIITTADLNQYTAKRRNVLTGFYHGMKIVTGPPPSSGGVVLMALNLLEKYPLATMAADLRTHYIVEALKHGFGHRTLLADPDFGNNVTENVNTIITKGYAQDLSDKIQEDKTFGSEFYLVKNQLATISGGTSHISIIDKDKNSVALTTTVNGLFGSKVISEKTGIVYNNQMDDFSSLLPNQFGLIPSVNNQISPGKRPLSSMSPTMVLNGKTIVHSIGGSGGPTIISGVLQALLNTRDLGLNPKLSIDALRVHNQLYPRTITVEAGFSQGIIDSLVQKGHNVTVQSGYLFDGQNGIGNVQMNTNYGSFVKGYSDPRKLGETSGY